MARQSVYARIALSAGLFLAVIPACSKAAVNYNADATVGSIGSFFGTNPAHLQLITLNGPESEYRIDMFTLFGLRINAANPASLLILNFWSGVDPLNSADALATATLVDQIVFTVPANAAPPGIYNIPLGSAAQPLDINIPSRTFGFEAVFTNGDGTQYSNTLSMRYTTGTPLIGSNPGFFYTDLNLDGNYSDTEQTRLAAVAGGPPAPSNLRIVIDSVAVPEPGIALAGLGGIMLLARRKR